MSSNFPGMLKAPSGPSPVEARELSYVNLVKGLFGSQPPPPEMLEALEENLRFRNDAVKTDSNPTKMARHNFATILVKYQLTASGKKKHLVSSYSSGKKTDGTNHSEQMVWRRATADLGRRLQRKEITIIQIVIASDLSPCVEESYANRCSDYFGPGGEATKGNPEEVLVFNPERDIFCYAVKGSLDDVIACVEEANKIRAEKDKKRAQEGESIASACSNMDKPLNKLISEALIKNLEEKGKITAFLGKKYELFVDKICNNLKKGSDIKTAVDNAVSEILQMETDTTSLIRSFFRQHNKTINQILREKQDEIIPLIKEKSPAESSPTAASEPVVAEAARTERGRPDVQMDAARQEAIASQARVAAAREEGRSRASEAELARQRQVQIQAEKARKAQEAKRKEEEKKKEEERRREQEKEKAKDKDKRKKKGKN